MADRPIRVQLKRAKGWKMPPNTIKVARPGKWGNPFKVSAERSAAEAVQAFRLWLTAPGCTAGIPMRQHAIKGALQDLRGKNLACFCTLDQPCHADVLLELANATEALL